MTRVEQQNPSGEGKARGTSPSRVSVPGMARNLIEVKIVMKTQTPDSIQDTVRKILADSAVVDIHTHLFDPAFGSLLLWGIDELVTYHYLVAEVFRACPDMAYDSFWKMPKSRQADLIWHELFVKRTPLSESCQGVLTVLRALGLDANTDNLNEIREYFSVQTIHGYLNKVFELAGVSRVYMTNDPMNPVEREVWEKGCDRDSRFLGVLRLDSALMSWPNGADNLKAMGYGVDSSLSGKTLSEVRRYLNDWCDKFDARYMAISLSPAFRYPDVESSLTSLMIKTVFPVARERGIPVAMMIGVKKFVNPELKDAGDSVGKADIGTVERIANDFSDVKFLITMLSRENTHELCVAARKFKNILPFGCWWFLNDPSLIREITAMRFELLGLSFIPQHSDARVLDQLIYKWSHSRKIIGDVLTGKYEDVIQAGRVVTEHDIQRDIQMLFDGSLIQ